MLLNISAEQEILIHSTQERVWKVLTSPELVKEYLFGTTLTTDWHPGNPVVFAGSYAGIEYTDKGTVLLNIPGSELSYSYLSSFSGLDDIPENYSIISLVLTASGTNTRLRWKQTGYKSEEMRTHSEGMIATVLAGIRSVAERAKQ